MPSAKGKGLNCFGLLSGDNKLMFTPTQSITRAFVFDYLERLSFTLDKPTVIVLDNAELQRIPLNSFRNVAWFGKNLAYVLPATLFSKA
jgi:hypothetical protein